MLRKALIVAGLLSMMPVQAQTKELSSQTTRQVIDTDTTIDGISGVSTTEDNARGGAIQNACGYDLTVKSTIEKNTLSAQNPNQVSLGGAIYQAGGKLTIEDGTVFNENTVTGYQQTYDGYDGTDYPAGGAIYMTGADATFTANGTVNFKSNKSTSSSPDALSTGGAIHFESIKSAIFDKANFSQNKSGAMGGAIYNGNTDISFKNVSFTENSSGTGGAIYMLEYQAGTDTEENAKQWSADKVTTKVNTGTNSNFIGNTATKNGGAIANFDGKLTVGQGNTFSGNKAEGTNGNGNGGAIYNAKWIGTPETTINGGTKFENNSATNKGGAIYNSGKLILDTTAGDITFSNNTAKEGADIYLDNDSTVEVTGSSHKVLFGSDGSLAGGGTFTNKGTVEFSGNNTVDKFNGKFIQDGESAKTTLNNSKAFSDFDIQKGELELVNGAEATLDSKKVKFSGNKLTVGRGATEPAGDMETAILTLGDVSNNVDVSENVTVNVLDNGEIDIANGKLTLNSGDSWNGGKIKLSSQAVESAASLDEAQNQSELILDGLTANGQSYIQEGGKLTLKNGSNLGISGEGSSVSGGEVYIENGTTLSVENNADIKDGAKVNVKGNLKLENNGKISGGTFNIFNGSNFNITGGTISGGIFDIAKTDLAYSLRNAINSVDTLSNGKVTVSGGTISSGTWNFHNSGELDIENGNINGGTFNFEDNSKGSFSDGSVSNGSKFNLKDQSEFDIKGGTFGGDIVLGEDNSEQTGSPKLKVESGATLSGHLDAKKGSSTDVSGTLTGQADVKGDVNIKNGGKFQSSQASVGQGGKLTVESGGSISGGKTTVNDGGKLDVKSGGSVKDTELTVDNGGDLEVSGTVDGSNGKVDLKEGSNTSVQPDGKLSLNDDDKMNGDVTNKGTVELDGYKGSEGSKGKFTQDGENAKFDLKNGSKFTLGNGEEGDGSSITKGSVIVEGGSSLDVKGGGIIGGDGEDNVKVEVKGGSSLTVEGEGKIQNSDVTVEGDKSGEGGESDQNSKFEVKDGGKVEGGKVDVKDGAELIVDAGGEISDADITAENGKITVKGDENASEDGSTNGGKISGGSVKATDGSTVDVQKGGEISDGDITIEHSHFSVEEGGKVTGGEITLGEGSSFDMAEGSDVSGGEFHFTGKMEGDIEIKGEIGEEAKYNFEGGNTYVIEDGGNVTTDSEDNWNDDTIIQLGRAETKESDATEKEIAEDTSVPELHWKGNKQNESHNKHGNGIFKGVKGKLTIESESQTFNIWGEEGEDGEKGFINEDVQVDLKAGSAIDVQENGEVTLNGNGNKNEKANDVNSSVDTWEGDVKVSGGKLTVKDMTGKTGKFEQTDGETIVKGVFELNQDDDKIEGGKLVIDNDGNNATLKQSKGTIDRKADVNIGEKGKLELSGGKAELDGKDKWEGTVQVQDSGNLTLSNIGGHNAKSGKLVQTGGEVTVRGSFDMNNEGDKVSGGKFNIGKEGKAGVVNQSKGKITKNAEVTIEEDSELNITGGSTVLNGNGNTEETGSEGSSTGIDTWKGKITLDGEGKLTLDDVVNPDNSLSSESDKSHGHLEAKDGELIIKGSSDITFSKEDFVDSAVKFTLKKGSSITIDGGEVTFDTVGDSSENGTAEKQTLSEGSTSSGDTWGGDVILKDGKLTYGLEKNGKLEAKGGELETKTGSKLAIKDGSYIEEDVKAEINGKLVISGSSNDENGENGGGRVTFNEGDTVTGDIRIRNNGHLTLKDGVTFKEYSGGPDEERQKINLGGDNAQLDFEGNGKLVLEANINGEKGKINKNGDGDIDFKGKTRNYKGTFTVNGSGTLDFYDEEGLGGHLIFGDDIEGENITIKSDKIMGSTKLDKKATITFETHTDGNDLTLGNNTEDESNNEVSASNGGTLNFNAKSGKLTFKHKVRAGKSETEGDNSNGEGGHINAYGSSVTFEEGIEAKDNSTVTVVSEDKATLNDVILDNSTLTVFGNGFDAKSSNFIKDSLVNVMDGNITSNDFGTVTFGPQSKLEEVNNFEDKANTAIDISPRNWTSDTFHVGGNKPEIPQTQLESGYFNVSNFQFVGKAPIDRHIYLRVFNSDIEGSAGADKQFNEGVTFDADPNKRVFSPIGYYGLNSVGDGVYDAYLDKYNNQVFRGQVAVVANWQNQLTLDNLLFNHVQEINMQYLTQENPNRYAAAFPQFAPYQYNKREGSIWVKPFGNFENLSMGHGIRVGNNFYGSLIGLDLPAKELKRNWTFMPTAYLGYTGGYQTFSHTSMTQNGGQGGFMGSFMHRDFIASVLAYGGGYNNEMDITGLYNYAGNYKDTTGNWYVGAAAKAAYNLHPTRHFTVQPNFLAAWSMFGDQKWHTGYGDMNMKAGYLNGVAVAPGLNLIYGRETWSMYFTIQYFYNIMSSLNGSAGNVDLPYIGMRHGFLEYGIGATKTWKDRLSGYLQIVLRNAGITGVGFQGGLMLKL